MSTKVKVKLSAAPRDTSGRIRGSYEERRKLLVGLIREDEGAHVELDLICQKDAESIGKKRNAKSKSANHARKSIGWTKDEILKLKDEYKVKEGHLWGWRTFVKNKTGLSPSAITRRLNKTGA
jgi:hypothetical protein